MIPSDELKVLTSYSVVPNAELIDLNYSPPRTFTATEANEKITQLAKGLQNLGLPDKARIAIMGDVSYEYLCIMLAVSQLGLTSVALNIKLPFNSVKYCLDDSNSVLILHAPEFKHLVPDGYKAVEIGSSEYNALHVPGEFIRPPYQEDNTQYILYTSGTTGNPKGVVISYKNRVWGSFYSFLQRQTLEDSPVTNIHVSPLYHLAGIIGLVTTVTISKSRDLKAVIMPRFNAREFINAIGTYKPNELRLVAPMMGMILAEKKLLLQTDLSSVKAVILTSSAAPEKMQREVRYFFKSATLVANPYGMTETGPVFSNTHPLGIDKPMNSVGYPLDGIETRIVDGVLQIKSNAMLQTYNNNPDAYSKLMTEDGFFITGDLFRVNKYGFYFFQGRADDMFKSGGEKIYPGEIESVIDKHPAVATSAVVGVPDSIKGYKPYAFVQLKPDENVTGEKLKEYAIRNVATYQIPREVWVLDELPKTSIGKIDRKLLADMAAKRIANH